MNGNRTSDSNGAYTYQSGSNKLSTVKSKAQTLDATGNLLNDGNGHTYTYDGFGRLATATVGTTTYTYQYNGRGQRVSKTGNGNTTLYVYGSQTQLVGEYDSSGAAKVEYIWLNGLPVALVTNGKTYYIHPDHLGTPREITDEAGKTVWLWAGEAFGNSAPNEDPGQTGTLFKFNLRFAGQYFDAETGLNYNGRRTYDPSLGRYTTSDPIGLAGGLNTFAYVEGNPLSYIDPLGLHKQDRWWGRTNRDFQRWFHQCWKQPGDPDADKHGIEEAYQEWLNRGSPKDGNCDGPKPPPEPAATPVPAPVPDSSGAQKAALATVGAVGAGYIAYRCIRMIPSLAPPLWWTIPANAAVP